MFCPKCKRFKPLSEWLQKWRQVVEQYDKANFQHAMNNFIPPKCAHCFEDSRRQGKRISLVELVQVRFIMTSANGEIKDVPWNKWIDIKQKGIHNREDALELDKYKKCCESPDLYYRQGEREDFTGIIIKCISCDQGQNLKGLFGLKVVPNSDSKDHFKVVVRSSNSVYYPILIHSLFLPVETKIADKDQKKINASFEKGIGIETIADFYDQYSIEDIQSFLSQSNEESDAREVSYRKSEYNFFLSHENFTKDSFIFHHEASGNLKEFGVSSLIKVSRLKMTTIQTGYTRQEPLDADLFLSSDFDKIKPQYTSIYGKNTEYLTGIENFGEGIFVSFDSEFIDKKIVIREVELQQIYQKSKSSPLFGNKFESWRHLGRFMFVHTFSHLIMKELEFSCGYPTVSLSERIFVDNEEMQGLLIYTVGGLEGGYGGLSSQADPEKFELLIKGAYERAEDCASDPICYHSEGQGIGEMNLAACYSCALVAENACESFNSFLDRKIILES